MTTNVMLPIYDYGLLEDLIVINVIFVLNTQNKSIHFIDMYINLHS